MLPLRQFAQERLAGEDSPAISAPNVFILHQRLVWTSDAEAHSQTEIDVVFNEVVATDDPFNSSVKQGVTDSVLEGAMIDGGEGTAGDTVLDVAAGKDWTLLGPGDEPRLNELPPDLRSRIGADITAGRLVLASLDPSSRGWWRIDPATGTVLAMRPNGGGASVAERAMLLYYGAAAGTCMSAVGAAIAGNSGLARQGAVYCVATGGLAAGAAFGFAGATALAGAGSAGVVLVIVLLTVLIVQQA
jgi:hypothetical protein